MWRRPETERWQTYTGTKPETADTAKESLHATAPAPDPTAFTSPASRARPTAVGWRRFARNLTDAVAGALTGFGHLIVDGDPLYTAHFRSLLETAGVKLLRLPPGERLGGLLNFYERKAA